ncbi:TPA: hypothetical protein HA259_06145 [Thermoplasmata archaeon]|nr:hypothetical protein [Thermoplasmata archaeon]
MRRRFAGILLAGVMLLASLSVANTLVLGGKGQNGLAATAVPIEDAEWTVMIYLDGDNNLETYALMDLAEMEAVGSVDGVNVVVLMDTYSLLEETHWYVMDSAGSAHVELVDGVYQSHCDCDLVVGGCPGELNMGDPDTLTYFIETAMTFAPAEHYMVNLWDHGGGWYGLCSDDTGNEDGVRDSLSLDETAKGIAAGLPDDFKLDIFASDACFMGTIEVAYEVRDIADYMVASVTTVPGFGWDYTLFLEYMHLLDVMDPGRVCEVAVDAYNDAYEVYCAGAGIGGFPYVSCSKMVLSEIEKLVGVDAEIGVDKLSDVLLELVQDYSYRGAIESSESQTPQIQFKGEIFPFADLGSLLELLGEKIPEISELTEGTLELLKAAVPYCDSITTDAEKEACINTYGLSIYFTQSVEKYRDYYGDPARGIDFALDTNWNEFLDIFCMD